MKYTGILLVILMVTTAFQTVSGQDLAEANTSSSVSDEAEVQRPKRDPSIMWKKTYWRRLDLREKMNRPFFVPDAELTKWIIEAVKAGELTPYTDESFKKELTLEEFNQKLIVPNAGGYAPLTEEEKAMGFTEKDIKAQEETSEGDWGDWGDTPSSAEKKETPKEVDDEPENAFGEATDSTSAGASEENQFFPNELALIELKEDVIFNRYTSTMYFDIKSLTIVIPAEKYETGIDEPLATFKFKELTDLLDKKPNAVWFNTLNNAEHRKFSEAFALRLFDSRIIKVSNTENKYLDTIYGAGKDGLKAGKEEEYKLLEFESGLWER